MPAFIVKMFVKNYTDTTNPKVRTAYGTLCGVFGIVLNFLLFCGKLTAGLISGSIAMIADAFNNISDAGSSLVMLIGFRLSSQKPDHEHPFGHGRIEYITGLIVSMVILLMGFELGKSSIGNIIEASVPTFDIAAVIILALSVVVKLYMYYYNIRTAKLISSGTMRAAAFDSLCDTAATSVVLVSTIISYFTDIAIDGWCGILVSAFILYSGIRAVIETANPLLGQSPDPELVSRIESLVKSKSIVSGIHDLIVHSYGPGTMFVSLHAEVPADGDLLELHDTIDAIEREIEETLHCRAIIHMDPVETDNAQINETREKIETLVRCIDDRLTLHDFRMVSGTTHTNVIFDLVVPYELKLSDKAIASKVSRMIQVLDPSYFAVIDVDKSFV